MVFRNIVQSGPSLMSLLNPLVAGFFAPLLALKVELKYLSKEVSDCTSDVKSGA